MEIERKFLVKQLPENLQQYKSKKIIQGYISTSPVIRVRQYGEEFIITMKNKGNIAREEYEMIIEEDDFKNLLKKVENNLIDKCRYYIPIENNYTAELDIYYGYLDGLLTVEVEFQDMKSCRDFVPPSWFGTDVSEDYRYKNSYLSSCKNNIPKSWLNKIKKDL